jgi:chromosome segregation ATPase
MRRTFAHLEEELTTLQRWKKQAQERLEQANSQLTGESERSSALLKQVEEAQAQAKRAVHDTEERLGSEGAEAKAEVVRLHEQLDENEARLEAATLGQELAEGQCEDLQEEVEEARAELEEAHAMLKAAEESARQAVAGASGDTADSAAVPAEDVNTLRAQRDHLREALVKLRDLSLAERRELQQTLRSMQKELEEAGKLQEQLDESEVQSLDLQEAIASLKEQLDLSAEAEELLVEAQEQNLSLQERVEQLQSAVDDLEALRELSTELEAEAQDTERELRAEVYQRDVSLLSRKHELEAGQRDITQLQQRLDAGARRTVALQQQIRDHEVRALRQAQEHTGQGQGLQSLVDEAVRLRRLCAALPGLRQRSLLAEGTLQLVEHRARFLLGFIPSPVLAEHRRAADRRLRVALAALRASVLFRLLDDAWSPAARELDTVHAALATTDGDRTFAWLLRSLAADAAQHLSAALSHLDQLSGEHGQEEYARLANAQWLPTSDGIDPLLALDTALSQVLRAQASDELNDTRADLRKQLASAVKQFAAAAVSALGGQHAGWSCARQIEAWHAQVHRAQLYAQRLWSGLVPEEEQPLLPVAHIQRCVGADVHVCVCMCVYL